VPTLTRRRSADAPDECWHVFYGDVRVGTIAILTGRNLPKIRQPRAGPSHEVPDNRLAMTISTTKLPRGANRQKPV
jgi:hypothetical protein